MIKIGIHTEKNLEILIREGFDCNFITIKNYPVQKIADENIILLIIDDTVGDIYAYLQQCKKYNFKIILMASVFDPVMLRKYIKEELIFDFLKKIDYDMLQESFETFKPKNNEFSKIFIDDIFVKAWILPEKILYISYISHLRKSSIQTVENKIYLSRKKLSDIEKLILSFPEFYKIKRNVIINMKHVKEINLKDEILTFDNNSTLSLSKNTLKNLEFYILNFSNSIQF